MDEHVALFPPRVKTCSFAHPRTNMCTTCPPTVDSVAELQVWMRVMAKVEPAMAAAAMPATATESKAKTGASKTA